MSSAALDRGRRVLRQRGVGAALRGVVDEARAQVEVRVARRRGPQTFVVDGVERTQLIHLYNRTWRNERAVEVPLALAFLDRHDGPVLEVGNVLVNYGRTGHVVLDKYERRPGVVNADVVDYRPDQRFGAIVAVSTLEHVGWDEEPQDPGKIPCAVQRLRDLLLPTGRLLVTCPLSYNPHLDALVEGGGLDPARQTCLVRDGSGRWRETPRADAFASARMGRHGANAVWVAELGPTPVP
jgi:SAM-dependent methyltransferase